LTVAAIARRPAPATFDPMSAKFARAVEAARQLSEDELDVLADELAALVEAHSTEAAHRDEETRRSLDELAAGRVMSLAEFDRWMDALITRLDRNAPAE
jgi:hypothetical protein